VSILSIGSGAATPVNVVNLSMSFRLSSYERFRSSARLRRNRHCEEPQGVERRRSLDALMATKQSRDHRAPYVPLDRVASLAMTATRRTNTRCVSFSKRGFMGQRP
jgi:hypothetical protein